MDRRAFIEAIACSISAAGFAARAQTAPTVRRIGVLSPDAPPTQADIELQSAPLRALGWMEGQNLLVERRYANDRSELLRPFAEELVRLKVEVIVTAGTPATSAAMSAAAAVRL